MKRQTIIQIILSILAISCLVYGRPISYPDAENRLHGLPFNWGTHQLGTIAGPVDYWSVSLSNLVLDLVIWFLIVQVIPEVIDRKQGAG